MFMSVIFSVLHSPKKTFEYIRENGGAFLIPFLVVIVITLGVAILQIPIIERTLDATDLTQLEGTGFDQEMFKKVSIYTGVAFSPIGVAAMVFITGLLLLLVNLVVRGEAKYMQLVKVTILATIPSLINGVLTGILANVTDAQNVNDLTISLGAVMEQKSGFLFGIASMINPFTIWYVALMVIGTAVMAQRPVKRVAIWIVAGYILINVPFAFFV